MKIEYLGYKKHYPYIFNDIYSLFSFRNDPIPNYTDNKESIEYLKGILKVIRTNYYPSFFDKAAYLFIELAYGHHFENGNKRLAVVSFGYFQELNRYSIRKKSFIEYKDKLKALFPHAEIKKKHEIKGNFAQGIYHLSRILANKEYRKGVSFDQLKEKVRTFLEFSLYKK